MIHLGVDPGKSGSIIALRGGKMQTCRFDKDTEHDVAAFLTRIVRSACKSEEQMFCIIEKVGPMPAFMGASKDGPAPSGQRGSIASFKLGMQYGFVRGCLIALGIPFDEITPVKWQRAMGIPIVKNETHTAKKNRHKAKAQQLFSEFKVIHQYADALLIAEYCRRKKESGL